MRRNSFCGICEDEDGSCVWTQVVGGVSLICVQDGAYTLKGASTVIGPSIEGLGGAATITGAGAGVGAGIGAEGPAAGSLAATLSSSS